MNWWSYARKPSVAERRQRAAREAQRLAKRLAKTGRERAPVAIDGRTIARSFWGKAWCENLESYRDYEYRLPRGRSYLRSGAVLDLTVEPGRITAVVAGSRPQPYEVEIKIKSLPAAHWSRIKAQCAGHIGSLLELLDGRLPERVMQIITHREQGLFPKPAQIEMSCSCPDWASMCKHVAAAMYGVGARFDSQPELIFTLRKVAHGELTAAAAEIETSRPRTGRRQLADAELGSVFGIELAEAPQAAAAPAISPRVRKARVPVKAKGKRRGRAAARARR